MPKQLEIVVYTVVVVATWSNRDRRSFSFDTHLTKELNLNPTRLRTLTGALRSYIQSHNQDETLRLSDIKRAGKLGPLVQTVILRMAGVTPSDDCARKLIAQSKASTI